jgi:hypothetical protein
LAPECIALAISFKLMIWSKDLLEIMFFTGLIGCLSAVVMSWISILKTAFLDADED